MDNNMNKLYTFILLLTNIILFINCKSDKSDNYEKTVSDISQNDIIDNTEVLKNIKVKVKQSDAGICLNDIEINNNDYNQLLNLASRLNIKTEEINIYGSYEDIESSLKTQFFNVIVRNKEIIGLLISDYQLKDIKLTSKFKKLEKLVLCRCNIDRIEGLENLSNLRELNLCFNYIGKIENINNLKKLEKLNLEWNRIAKIEGVENLSNLSYLNLDRNYIRKIEGLDKLTKLNFLSLGINKITELEGLEELNNLETLLLYDNEIIEIESLNKLKKLIKLNLGSNKITKLEGLDKLGLLQFLYLNDNKIEKISYELPLLIKKLKKLSEIDIIDSYMPDEINKIHEIKKKYYGKINIIIDTLDIPGSFF